MNLNFFFFLTVDSYNGSVLRLARLERKQMGSYLCIGKANFIFSTNFRRILCYAYRFTIWFQHRMMCHQQCRSEYHWVCIVSERFLKQICHYFWLFIMILFVSFLNAVAPSVRAPSQLLGAPLGSDVQLNCQVEASPAPVSVSISRIFIWNEFLRLFLNPIESIVMTIWLFSLMTNWWFFDISLHIRQYWLKGGKMQSSLGNGLNNAEMGQPRPEMLLDG